MVPVKGKLSLLGGAAIGYVLGARAGRERYDQIRERARRAWGDPRVQQKVSDVQGVVQDKAPDLRDKVTGTAAAKLGRRDPGTQQDGSGI